MIKKNLKKFFIPDNYLSRLRIFRKKIKIRGLNNLNPSPVLFKSVWNINQKEMFEYIFSDKNIYSVFGLEIKLEEDINWHQDKFSGFIYPLKRFDKLKASQWFDQGIELVFPWELSRFYFGINLTQKYLVSKDKSYYELFKKLSINWIDSNQFLIGVNWLSTMDVAIRAVNWIVTINLFGKNFTNDTKELKDKISSSLIIHAEYIFSFPLIEKKGLTTNHTTSAYTGLLFLALTLKDHPKSALWLNTAVKGLEECMENQVYEDGVNFEGSVPYHRLVLELFAYSAIVGLSNRVEFSANYLIKLFKMFEYSAAYMDSNGNAPQVGDNDSGRLLIFNSLDNDPYKNEHDHSYLLNLGENIFEHKFTSQCKKRDSVINKFLPLVNKISLNDLKVNQRATDKSISFNKGGAYFIKNDQFNLLVSCFTIGQSGKGGHNHLDTGSFTLSINGTPVIVDPGSYCYSKNKIERDNFRSYIYHNTLYNLHDEKLEINENPYWGLKKYYDSKIFHISDKSISILIQYINDNTDRYRTFQLIGKSLVIKDEYKGNFISQINLHPEIELIEAGKEKILFSSFNIKFKDTAYKLSKYSYSPHYGKSIEGNCIQWFPQNNLEIIIELL